MNGLFRRETFAGFGACGLDEAGEARPLTSVQGRRPGRLRQAVRRLCPRTSGVYGMIDRAGELIYVGKAKALRTRLLGYFRPNSRDEKAGKIIRETCRLVWEPVADEFAALLRELELIRRWRPRFNVQGQPRRQRRVYLCVGRRPAPYAFVATKPPGTAAACFGPVSGMRRAGEAARKLNDWYRLRDCPQKQTMVFADQRELFPVLHAPGCIRHDLGSCLAPCAAACTQPDYAFHVAAALDFLHGRDRTPLDQLTREMTQAAADLQFERAAVLRDRLDTLEWLWRQLDRLRDAVRQSGVYAVDGAGGATWYLIRGGAVRAAIPAPADEVTREKAAMRLAEVFAADAPSSGPPRPDEVDGVLLVSSWFRRHRQERDRLLNVDVARRLAEGVVVV